MQPCDRQRCSYKHHQDENGSGAEAGAGAEAEDVNGSDDNGDFGGW